MRNGVLRRYEENRVVPELVREAKGQDEFHLEQLRFAHDERKVRAGQRYFEALGIDYRVVTDLTPGWWQPSEQEQQIAADFEG